MSALGALSRLISQPLILFEEIVAPRHCEVCGFYIGSHYRKLEFMCDNCFFNLPKPPSPENILNQMIAFFPADELAISNFCSLFHVSDSQKKYIQIIYALKYHSFRRVGNELGNLLGKLLQDFGFDDYDLIIPVPIHHARLRERGFNQADIIAKAVSKVLKVRYSGKIVKRNRYTVSQTTLSSSSQRKENLQKAFDIKRNFNMISNRKLLLIDDVLTTGSTINSLGMLLLESGARQIDAATLAKA